MINIISAIEKPIQFLVNSTRSIVISHESPILVTEEEYKILVDRLGSQIKLVEGEIEQAIAPVQAPEEAPAAAPAPEITEEAPAAAPEQEIAPEAVVDAPEAPLDAPESAPEQENA
jgi:hypothetical protein